MTLEEKPGAVIVRDLYADAIEAGELSVVDAIDGLRRWRRFLDLHLHSEREPRGE